MISLKTSETVDWPSINNALQINRLQPCASLLKAQAIHTSIGMDIMCVCHAFKSKASND
jgi:hypothetical protein